MIVKLRFILTFFISIIFLSKSFTQTTRPPTPLMGNNMLKEFFLYHLNYPEESLENSIEGKVEIAFSVDINGNVTSKEIVLSVTKELDREALRLFKMIIWQPALKYGIQVSGTDIFDVNFKIKKYNKAVKRREYTKIATNYSVDSSYKIYNLRVLDSIPKPLLSNGYNNLYNYVYDQIKYPQRATELEIEGKVEICFIIEANGLGSNFIVKQSVGGGCTSEALRIIKDIKWRPGFKDKLAVRTKKIMFIEFRLSNINSGKHIPNQSNSGL